MSKECDTILIRLFHIQHGFSAACSLPSQNNDNYKTTCMYMELIQSLRFIIKETLIP